MSEKPLFSPTENYFRLVRDTPTLVQRYRRLLTGLGLNEKDLWFEGCDGTRAKSPCVDWYPKWGLRLGQHVGSSTGAAREGRQSRQANGFRSRQRPLAAMLRENSTGYFSMRSGSRCYLQSFVSVSRLPNPGETLRAKL
jgi:hypothetical protein